MTRTLSHWTQTGRVFIEDDGQLTWTGALGETNVPDPVSPGGYAPHRWDGTRLHYAGNRSVRVDGCALVFELDGQEVARSELELRKANKEPLPATVHVECDPGDRSDHGAVLRITCEHEGESCEHEIRTDGSRLVVAAVKLRRGQGKGAVKRVAIKHRAAVDDWAVLWDEVVEGPSAGKRSIKAGDRGHGILRASLVPFGKVPEGGGRVAGSARVGAATVAQKPTATRDFKTDEPGGELEIEWDAAEVEAGVFPDTYGPATATQAGVYECGTGGVETEFQGAGSGYGTYLDESYNLQMQAGVVFWGVTFSGTVTAASLVMARQSQNNGTNGTVGMRCEASNTPVEPLTNNPWGRTYRSTETQVTFPNSNATVTFDPTTNLNDLLAAGYTYTGGATQGVHLAFAGGAKSWYNTGTVSWRSVCNGTSGTRPILTITYTPASSGTNYTLTADPGSVGGTGGAATLKVSRVVAAAAGSAAASGVAAALAWGRSIAADTGSYTATGGAAGTVAGRALTAAAGASVCAGSDASLAAYRVISAEAVAATAAVSDAGLTAAFQLSGESGSFACAGSDANLVDDLATSYTLTAEAGAAACAGADAALTVARTAVAGAGAAASTGGDAQLQVARVVAAGAGSVVASGSDAGQLATRVLVAAAGSAAFTGFDADLVYTVASANVLVAEAGSVASVGVDAGLVASLSIAADAGASSSTGQDANLSRGYRLVAAASSSSLDGFAASLLAAISIASEGGSAAAQVFDAVLSYGRSIDAEPGSASYGGSDVALTLQRVMIAPAGSVAAVGFPATLLFSGVVYPTPGTALLSATNAAQANLSVTSAALARLELRPWLFR